jgi:REP element-mobilizing transposase RayT
MNDHERRRKRLRLSDYDYASYGAYFVTIVTNERRTLFGDVDADGMTLNALGRSVDDWWLRLASKFEKAVELDEYVVMPNHLHGIVWLTHGPLAVPQEGGHTGPPLQHDAYRPAEHGRHMGPPLPPEAYRPAEQGGHAGPPLRPSLTEVIQWFKTMAVNEYLRDAKARDVRVPPLWQRGYYDHIVRDDRDLQRIREYIIDNPRKWAEDEENPER